MISNKKEVFGFRTLVSKIWSHIKYRSRGYGTPDYEEGFLGIDTMGWMNFQSKMHRIIDTCKWKSKAIKKRTKTLFACAQSWKLPKVIEQFQDAMYQAERDLDEQYEKNSDLEEQLESAVEDIINARSWHNRYPSIIEANLFSNNKKKGKFLDESHKDYEDDLEDIRGLYEGYGLRIPDGFLSEKEIEDRMWEGYDRRYDYHFDAVDDFDYFRCQIDKSFYNKSKVWDEERLPKLEKEKKDREEAEARLND
tara:strand:+ start:686 stop:1438 length:753 start_codon:yes stop_codon:yes gene_type:complete